MDRSLALRGLALGASLASAGCALFPPTYDNGPIPSGDHACTGAGPATGTGAGVVPAEPTGAPAPGSGSTLLAISKVYYGDTDTSGSPSNLAWKQFGLNIDGKVTSSCSVDVCTLVAGASTANQIDGDDGIDNSFGSNVMPLIGTLDPMFSVDGNNQLTAGDATTLLQLDGTGASPSYSPFPGALLRATPASSAPRWDGSDVRDVDTSSLAGGSLSEPLAVVSGGYMNQRMWVGVPATGTALLDMHLTVNGYPMPPVPIEHVQIVMKVASDGSKATQGTLAGVVRTADAAAWTRRWLLAAGSQTLCNASAADSIVSQVEQASDILADGTNGPGQTCDAISVGLGFEATAVALGQAKTLSPAPLPSAPDCDGGVSVSLDGG